MELGMILTDKDIAFIAMSIAFFLLAIALVLQQRELNKTKRRLRNSDKIIDALEVILNKQSEWMQAENASISAQAIVDEDVRGFVVKRIYNEQTYTIAIVRYNLRDESERDYAKGLAEEIADKLNEALYI